MNRAELDQDKLIDPSQLDVEAARQADVFFTWAERAAEAKARVDSLAFELDVLESRLQMRAREHPEKFGIKNTTEMAIKAAVKIHDDYIAATRELIEAKREADLLSRAVTALEQKKRMIEVLITLHGQEYFAGPSVPRDLVSAWNEYQDKRATSVNDRQRSHARRRRQTLGEDE